MKPRPVIKLYDYRALLRLVLKDMERLPGVGKVTRPFHYLGGLDAEGNIFIRVDLKPLRLPDDREK